ncbi:MAG: hypothetical protein H6559_04890 [Lewinellaceae bacterium]|nr:hypothetical protein [Lewinellaceae bacterium]
MMVLAVFIVVPAADPYGARPCTVAFFARMMGWAYEKPSPTAIRNWVIRCGYYALT